MLISIRFSSSYNSPAAIDTTNNEVAVAVEVHPATVSMWRARFVSRRLDGLSDDPRPGAPRTVTDEDVERVIVKTLDETPDRCDALVDEVDGESYRYVTDSSQPDLASVWSQTSPYQRFQAVARSPAY